MSSSKTGDPTAIRDALRGGRGLASPCRGGRVYARRFVFSYVRRRKKQDVAGTVIGIVKRRRLRSDDRPTRPDFHLDVRMSPLARPQASCVAAFARRRPSLALAGPLGSSQPPLDSSELSFAAFGGVTNAGMGARNGLLAVQTAESARNRHLPGPSCSCKTGGGHVSCRTLFHLFIRKEGYKPR